MGYNEVVLMFVPRNLEVIYEVMGIYREVRTELRPYKRGLLDSLVIKTVPMNIVVYGEGIKIGPNEWKLDIGLAIPYPERYGALKLTKIGTFEIYVKGDRERVMKLLHSLLADICGVIRAHYPKMGTWSMSSLLTNRKLWDRIELVVARELKESGLEITKLYPERLAKVFEKLRASE